MAWVIGRGGGRGELGNLQAGGGGDLSSLE